MGASRFEAPDVSAGQRTLDQELKHERKLRWIGGLESLEDQERSRRRSAEATLAPFELMQRQQNQMQSAE